MGHFTEALGPKKIKKLEQSNHVGEYKSIIPYQIESHEQINVNLTVTQSTLTDKL